MEGYNSHIDAVLNDELRKLNSHLPKGKKTLKQLLTEMRPSIRTVRGDESVMRKAELETLSRLIPSGADDKISLPFVFMRRLDLGPGAYELFGELYDQYVIARLMKVYQGDFEEFKRSEELKNIFYRTQIIDLMKQIHSLIVLGFSP